MQKGSGMHIESQKNAVSYLERLLHDRNFPPAILMYGGAGSGKGYLMRQFARDYLCTGGGVHACGACYSCDISRTLRHPDFIILSSRDVAPAAAALADAADQAAPELLRQQAMALLYELEKKFLSGLWPLKKSAGKAKDKESFPGEDFMPLYASLERDLAAATEARQIVLVLEELQRLSRFVQRPAIPVDSVRAVRQLLGRHAVLSQRRVVLIEDISTMNKEGSNAFLKTLEEPPEHTIILLAASDISQVLPTIRSRSALLPLRKMRAAEMQQLALHSLGMQQAPDASGCRDFYTYIAAAARSGEYDDVKLFFESLASLDATSSWFGHAAAIAEGGRAGSFFVSMQDLIADTIIARETGRGSELLMLRLLNGYPVPFLRRVFAWIGETAGMLSRNNLNARMQLIGLYMKFFTAGTEQ
jgi:DNA polymerase III delta prime subunit